MKKILATIALLVLLVGAPLFGQPLVMCEGIVDGCGGGPTLYAYMVDVGPDDFLQDFLVGTDDPNIANYMNWLLPPGWIAQIVGAPILDNGFTPKGGLSMPRGNCVAAILFVGPPVPTPQMFGFDHMGHPHDVGWQLTTIRGVSATEDWMQPVGLGMCPVHSPVEEGTVVEPGDIN